MRTAYPSDVTKEQFEIIRHMLETAKKSTHPRSYDIYDIFCAVLYLLKEGCRWRSIPHDFPKWQNVYYHNKVWTETLDKDGKSVLDRALEELVLSERVINGRNPEPTMTIIDSKSVKNTFIAEEKGYDGGKKNIGSENTLWS